MNTSHFSCADPDFPKGAEYISSMIQHVHRIAMKAELLDSCVHLNYAYEEARRIATGHQCLPSDSDTLEESATTGIDSEYYRDNLSLLLFWEDAKSKQML